MHRSYHFVYPLQWIVNISGPIPLRPPLLSNPFVVQFFFFSPCPIHILSLSSLFLLLIVYLDMPYHPIEFSCWIFRTQVWKYEKFISWYFLQLWEISFPITRKHGNYGTLKLLGRNHYTSPNFSHYTEAWKLWYTEVAEKKPLHLLNSDTLWLCFSLWPVQCWALKILLFVLFRTEEMASGWMHIPRAPS